MLIISINIYDVFVTGTQFIQQYEAYLNYLF